MYVNFQEHNKFILVFKCPFALALNSEQDRTTEDVTTDEEHSRTEDLSSHSEDFATKLENVMEDQNTMSNNSKRESDFQTESSFHCTLPSESCGEMADENEQSSHCCTTDLQEAGLNSQEISLSEQELYNSFHFWRTPLPEIDIDFELQQTSDIKLDREIQELTMPVSPSIPMATRKELEEMIENLEPHIDDPDVKGMVKILKHFYCLEIRICCFSNLAFNLLVVLKVRSTVFSWSSKRLRKIDDEQKGNLHLCKDF